MSMDEKFLFHIFSLFSYQSEISNLIFIALCRALHNNTQGFRMPEKEQLLAGNLWHRTEQGIIKVSFTGAQRTRIKLNSKIMYSQRSSTVNVWVTSKLVARVFRDGNFRPLRLQMTFQCEPKRFSSENICHILGRMITSTKRNSISGGSFDIIFH